MNENLHTRDDELSRLMSAMAFPIHYCFNELSKPASVAVIMRTKNRPVLFARAVASVCCQKFQDLHLYIVNDGGDAEKVEAVLAPYRPVLKDKITVVHNQVSAGMEAASNIAARKVTEKYCVIHDDDDSWHPKFLQETVAFLEDPKNAGFGGVITWSKRVEEEVLNDNTVKLHFETDYNSHLKEIDIFEMLRGNTFPPISFLFRAELFQIIGFFNEALPVLGDWDFNIRVLTVADIGLIRQSLAYYHHRSQMRDQYGNSIIEGLSSHQQFNLLYRNNLLRAGLLKSPELTGVLMATAMSHRRLRETVDHLHRRLDETVWRLDEIRLRLRRPNFFKKLERSIRKRRKKLQEFFSKKMS